MKLEVGMYVRTKQRCLQMPQIAKIVNISKDSGYKNMEYITLDINLIPDFEFHIYKEDIEKADFDIIKLIKKGDYVNGLEVTKVSAHYSIVLGDYDYCVIHNCEVKSIVTKEQFSQMEYKVGE